jgi:hypothetical protein
LLTRTDTSSPVPIFADATIPNGFVLIVPLPLTSGLGATTGPLHMRSVFHWKPGGSDPLPGVAGMVITWPETGMDAPPLAEETARPLE